MASGLGDGHRRMRAEDLEQDIHWRAGQLLMTMAGDDPDLFERGYTARLDEILPNGFL